MPRSKQTPPFAAASAKAPQAQTTQRPELASRGVGAPLLLETLPPHNSKEIILETWETEPRTSVEVHPETSVG